MKFSLKYIILCVLAAWLLSACSQNEKQLLIGVSQCSDDEWRAKMNHELRREAYLHPEIELTILSAHDDNARQSADIDSLVGLGIDLLVVSPNEAEAVRPAVERAFDKGIPVIMFDRKTQGEKYNAFVGADNVAIGQEVGDFILSETGGKPTTVLEVRGLAGSSTAAERHQGFIQRVEGTSVTLLPSIQADWTAEGGATAMRRWLEENDIEKVDYVFSQNDRMARAAYREAARAAREKGREKLSTRFIGIDGISHLEVDSADRSGLTPYSPYGIDLVAEDTLRATFLYPSGGDKVINLALDILKGKSYERNTILPSALITKDNARVMLLQTSNMAEMDNKLTTLNSHLSNFMGLYTAQRTVMILTLIGLVLLILLLAVVIRGYWTKKRLNERLSDDKLELEERLDQLVQLQHRLEDATNAKLVFFTNISHDFRTPLTLLVDPVDELLKRKDLPEDARLLLKMIGKNTAILRRLVNQILDFRKFENGNLRASLKTVDLPEALTDWCEGFKGVASRRKLTFTLKVTEPNNDVENPFRVLLDPEKTERIVFNLLSNALKYTPPGGNVTLALDLTKKDGKEMIRLRVEDTGRGISADNLPNIFDRLYQVDKNNPGSGIGLALVKAFAEVQGGEVEVVSKEGEGSVFTVLLPYQPSAGEEATFGEAPLGQEISIPEPTEELGSKVDERQVVESSKPTLLVIDDNSDIRAYIRHLTERDYNVVEAENGQQGVEVGRKTVPDVVVCDVMMPVMDGLECCRQLKSVTETSHIPIVMLTACSLDEQRAKGYECGADSYLSKPFSSAVLETRLRNLLENRRRLSEFFGDRALIKKADVSKLDKDFATRLRDTVDENLADPEFSVDALAEKMNLSRVQLYRKVKALIDTTPTDLLRTARLRRAKALLDASEKTIAEIAYETGFSSPSYFTKCYREEYGTTPKEHREGKPAPSTSDK